MLNQPKEQGMGVWQIVAATWRGVAAHWSVVLIVLGFELFRGLAALPAANPEMTEGARLAVVIVLGLLYLFAFPFIHGGCLTAAAGDAQDPLGAFWQGGRRLYLRLLSFELFTMLLAVGAFVAAIVLFLPSALTVQVPAAGIMLALLASVPIGILIYLLLLMTAMAPVVIAIDGKPLFAALTTGLRVARALLGRLLLLSLALFATLLPLLIAAAIPGILIESGAAEGPGISVLAISLQSAANAIVFVSFIFAYVLLYRRSRTA
jgi:hypothetical protein